MSMQLAFGPGTYRGKITRWGVGKAGTGTPQLSVTVQILGKVDTSDSESGLLPAPNYERTIFRAITEKTIDYVIADLRRLGYDRDGFADAQPESPTAFDFFGIECNVVCEHDSYQGKAKERWSFGGGTFEQVPLEPNVVKSLDALFGKKFKESRKTSPVQPMGQPAMSQEAAATAAKTFDAPPAPMMDSDSIPF